MTFGDTFSRYASGGDGRRGGGSCVRARHSDADGYRWIPAGRESPLLASQLNYVRCFKAMLESRFGNYLRFFSAR